MSWAVQYWLIGEHADERLNVHKNLRSAEDHEAEVATSNCFEGYAWAEMEWRDGHIVLSRPNA
ncbi:MAG: hypothetical protein K8I04_01725 [Gammaproteobacteria bacterium]|nr:hypothetical protein [Gammaproteobacteria bacterium]